MSDLDWKKIERELRRAARSDAGVVDRIMAEVLAEPPPFRAAAVDGRSPRTPGWGGSNRRFLAAAAVLLLVLAGGLLPGGGESRDASTAGLPSPRQPVQFVLVSRSASHISLVGDFNGWDPRATPLRRTSPDGMWSVVVPLGQGRHQYAFLVDGREWVVDPSAPRSPEDEFGSSKSVLLVGESL
ncbi:MAG TPA: isoamylase early set domain-containing protein [Longimicrobiaceae bacterium]|nr:isoamylase early set domain-containing protein [Longimicrobiaceae bacterium]